VKRKVVKTIPAKEKVENIRTVILFVPLLNMSRQRLIILVLFDLAWWRGTWKDRNAVDDVGTAFRKIREFSVGGEGSVLSGRRHYGEGIEFQVLLMVLWRGKAGWYVYVPATMEMECGSVGVWYVVGSSWYVVCGKC
jgi:hypothetical protein